MKVDCECPKMGSGDWVTGRAWLQSGHGNRVWAARSGWGWWQLRL